MMAWIGRTGAAQAEDVMAHMGTGRTATYRRLATCTDAGLLARLRLLHGQPSVYVATAAGLRWTDLVGLRPCRVNPTNLPHLIACTVVWRVLAADGQIVIGERKIHYAERESGQLVASIELPGTSGRARVHRPDMALASFDGAKQRLVAVEVELTAKGSRRLDVICRGWARARHVAGVRYYAPPPVQRVLHQAIARNHCADRIQVLALPITNA